MKPIDVEDLRLHYDPEEPQARFKGIGLAASEAATASERLPQPPPWPQALAPTAAPMARAPAQDAPIGRYDAVVVTWTSAEAAALAALLTPGHPVSTWYEYRCGVDAYVPKVTGARAPFNSRERGMERYYRSLGLYFPCRIGRASVLLFKSGLHLDYDGPDVPVLDLMGHLAASARPKVFVTTGTGGGIGADVKLGDVVVAGVTAFDCRTQFAGPKFSAWNTSSYRTSPVPAGALDRITPALTTVNAARIAAHGAREAPKVWAAPADTIVTTDFFGFDDTTDHYRLQGAHHRACDMGDAMVGRALSAHPGTKWFAIRNASDPQIRAPGGLAAAEQEAGHVYAECGAFTTAASVIATWAVVGAACDL